MGWFPALWFARFSISSLKDCACFVHALWLIHDEGYLKEQRYYNNTTHDQIHSSDTLGIDSVAPFFYIFEVVRQLLPSWREI